MANQIMRITLKAYDHQLIDSSAAKIIDTVKKNGSQVSGPVPLPTKKDLWLLIATYYLLSENLVIFATRLCKLLIINHSI